MLDKLPGLCQNKVTKGKEKEIKKMMTWEVEELYDDYCFECEENGIEPKPINQWWEELI